MKKEYLEKGDNMFESEDNYETAKVSQCRPDYESMAAKLHKKIEAGMTCLKGLKVGLEAGSLSYLDWEDKRLIFAIIGNLSFRIQQDSNEYQKLLQKVENS